MCVYWSKNPSFLNPLAPLTHPKCSVHTHSCPGPQIHHYFSQGFVNQPCLYRCLLYDIKNAAVPPSRRHKKNRTSDANKYLRIRITERIDSVIGQVPTTGRQKSSH